MDAVASVAMDGDAGAILGASDAVDVAAAEVLPELKNGGAPPRAAILPMVKLGCIPTAVSLAKLVAVAGAAGVRGAGLRAETSVAGRHLCQGFGDDPDAKVCAPRMVMSEDQRARKFLGRRWRWKVRCH